MSLLASIIASAFTTDPRFLDPTGWTPYQLQLDTPWDTDGIPWKEWVRMNTYDPAELAMWLAVNNPDAVREQKEQAKKKR